MSTANGGPQNGDVIKIYEDITVSDWKDVSVSEFTLQSAKENGPVTITDACYSFYSSDSTIKLHDVIFSGPGIYPPDNCVIQGLNNSSKITFKNSPHNALLGNSIELSNGQFYFEDNFGSEAAGAIWAYGSLELSNGQFYFTRNSAADGGAIYATYSFELSNGQFTFTGNSADYGGAIDSECNLTFSGDDTVATFMGNVAGYGGNDIWIGAYESNSTLTIKNKGTYFFDGGIYLDKYNDRICETIIDEAQVTIAGRQYKPALNEGDPENVEDNTNKYNLETVTISNGGKLTAQLDYINGLTADVTISDNQSAVVLTDSNKDQTATIKSSSDDGGSVAIVYEAEGSVSSESLFISSGRVDIKGALDATLEVGENATFSPGNSVGDTVVTGAFTLDPNATLLIEMDETGIDTITASTFVLDGQIDFQMTDDIPSGFAYDILKATNQDFTFGLDILDRVLGDNVLPDYMSLSLEDGGKTVRMTVKHADDATGVPEPSTWALMALGVAGLMYWRKRK